MRKILAVVIACAAPVSAWAASAFELVGTKQITLTTRDGVVLPIGTVTFTPKDGATTFAVHIETAKFQDFFLSMREFKCLAGPELECYVPYPYKTPGTVSATDLGWLSHSLLFFFKNPADYGAKLTNGLIYDLKLTDHGIEGLPQAVDLNAIASPPADLAVPPYDKDARSDIADGTRWISKLSITDAPTR